MKTTVELVDELKARYRVTDYGACKLLGISKNAIGNYRHRGHAMAAPVALRLAELLDLDPAYVRACVEAERAAEQPAERAMWERIAQVFGKAALLALFTAAPFMAPPSANASNAPVLHNGEQSTHWRRKRVFGVAL